MTRRLATASVALATLTTLAAAPAGPEAEEYVVSMGAVDPAVAPNDNPPGGEGRTDRFEYLAFYPNHLQVHRGDTVFFRRDGFHTATFHPDLSEAPRHVRREEVQDVAAFAGGDPTDPSCVGSPTAEPCVLSDPQGQLTSGFNSMRMTVDLPEGIYTYYCQIHDGMAGQVEVVGDDVEIPTPDDVLAAAAATVAADTANGEAVIEAGQVPEVSTVDDRRVWTVMAGDFTDDGRVAVLRFLPSALSIEPGDDVEFVVPDAGTGPTLDPSANGAFEIHTASFPADAYPLGFLTYLNPACDPDEVDAGLPSVPLRYEALLAGCPAGTTFEFQYQPWAWRTPLLAPGGIIAGPLTTHDSGLLTPPNAPCRSACDPWTGQRMPDRTGVSFPNAGTFSYVCNVHPEWGMAGGIEVAA